MCSCTLSVCTVMCATYRHTLLYTHCDRTSVRAMHIYTILISIHLSTHRSIVRASLYNRAYTCLYTRAYPYSCAQVWAGHHSLPPWVPAAAPACAEFAMLNVSGRVVFTAKGTAVQVAAIK